MIRFFYKIRQKLFSEGKFTHYILYALGEIILIVIGILIAITIDNNNELRKIKRMEQVYLSGLKSEFEQNKNKLQTLIETNRLNYEDAQKLANFIATDSFPDEKTLSNLLFNAFSYEIAYNPNNSLLTEVISTGYLKYISNPTLRQELAAWESVIQGIHRQEAGLREQRKMVVDIFRSESGSIRTILEGSGVAFREMQLHNGATSHSNITVLQTREFENVVLLYALSGIKTETNHYTPLTARIDRILQLIELEIK